MQKILMVICIFYSYFLFSMQEQGDKNASWKALITIALNSREAYAENFNEISVQANERELRGINRGVSTEKEQNYCSVCERAFKNIAYFNNHMAVHEGTSKYICAYCQEQFPQNCNLQRHIRSCSKKHT